MINTAEAETLAESSHMFSLFIVSLKLKYIAWPIEILNVKVAGHRQCSNRVYG